MQNLLYYCDAIRIDNNQLLIQQRFTVIKTDRPWQTCDRLAADLRPGRDRPLFSRVMATAIRPTHELKDRLVAYLRPYP